MPRRRNRPGQGRKPLPEGARRLPLTVSVLPATLGRLDATVAQQGSTRSRVVEDALERDRYLD